MYPHPPFSVIGFLTQCVSLGRASGEFGHLSPDTRHTLSLVLVATPPPPSLSELAQVKVLQDECADGLQNRFATATNEEEEEMGVEESV